MKHYFTSLALLLSFSFLSAQSSSDQLINMTLHICVIDAETGIKTTSNYHNEEAANLDIPAFLATQDLEDDITIFGTRRNQENVISYQFDSKRMNRDAICTELCEKVIKIDQTPYLGIAVTATDDFTGVGVNNILDGTAASEGNLQDGDVITSIQAYDITNPCELTTIISDQEVGGTIEVEYNRDGESKRDYIKMGSKIKKTITWVNCCAPETTTAVATINNDISLAVFPNPTPDLAQFDFNTTSRSVAELQVTDITGMILFEKSLYPVDGGARDFLNFNNMASGIFLVRIKQDGKQVVERVIVQRK